MSIFTRIVDLQNLDRAWQHISKRHPAEGVDHINWKAFENNKKLYLQQLKIELTDRRYQSQPVKILEIEREGKIREVSIFTIKDRVVQQSVVTEINKLYGDLFSDSCFAYRSGRSAMSATEHLHREILTGGKGWCLRGDIRNFFDEIDQEKLYSILSERIKEAEVLEIIRRCLSARYFDKNGEMRDKKRGIYQGAILAPILSNIYLMDLDYKMEKESGFYLRYSDDFIILEHSRDQIVHRMEIVSESLHQIGLELHPEKTQIASIEEGLDFLGYHFDEKGRSIPCKAEKHLQNVLEDMWLSSDLEIEEKLEKSSEIIQGWEQYYRGARKPGSILEFVLKVNRFVDPMFVNRDILVQQRQAVKNSFSDVLEYLIQFWDKISCPQMVLYEYEDYYSWSDERTDPFDISEEFLLEITLVVKVVVSKTFQKFISCILYDNCRVASAA